MAETIKFENNKSSDKAVFPGPVTIIVHMWSEILANFNFS